MCPLCHKLSSNFKIVLPWKPYDFARKICARIADPTETNVGDLSREFNVNRYFERVLRQKLLEPDILSNNNWYRIMVFGVFFLFILFPLIECIDTEPSIVRNLRLEMKYEIIFVKPTSFSCLTLLWRGARYWIQKYLRGGTRGWIKSKLIVAQQIVIELQKVFAPLLGFTFQEIRLLNKRSMLLSTNEVVCAICLCFIFLQLATEYPTEE